MDTGRDREVLALDLRDLGEEEGKKNRLRARPGIVSSPSSDECRLKEGPTQVMYCIFSGERPSVVTSPFLRKQPEQTCRLANYILPRQSGEVFFSTMPSRVWPQEG